MTGLDSFLASLALGLLGATASSAPAETGAEQSSERPNIIFIMADDLGYGDLGCYGQKMIQTPQLDRLAAEGTRFTQAYAGSTVCAPSRCCLMTGVHNGHARIRDNIPHGIFLKDDDVTIAEVLKQAGYRTGAIGKWSLGIHGSQGKPNDQGFDDWFGHLDQDQAHFYYPHYLWDNDRIRLLTGNRGEQKKEYTHDLFTERALQFIKQSSGGPFFLYLAYTIPHWSDYPGHLPESQIVPSDQPYTDRGWPQVEKNYAAMVTRMDTDVGRIMTLVKERGLDERTVVFFTSDNGPCAARSRAHKPAFFSSAGPLRGAKRDVYEGGIRIPMIVRWPGRIPARRVCKQVWAFWDLMPTFADIAHAKIPCEIDGISMLPTLLGRPQARSHEYLYWDYGHVRGTFKQAVRMGNWKGVRNGVTASIELYDLSQDIGESRDLAGENPQVVAKIAKVMQQAHAPSPAYPIRQKGKRQ